MVDGPQELRVSRLGRTSLLVSTLCWRGAYNEGIGYWVVNDAPPFKATLVTASGGDDDGRVISSAHKGRGLGDCWSTASWGWTGAALCRPMNPPPACAGWSRLGCMAHADAGDRGDALSLAS